jgi:hypothetical protein
MSSTPLRRLRTVGAAALAALSTLALVGDKLKAVGGSPLLAHAYVLGDVFKVEAVLFLCLIVAYPKLSSMVLNLRNGLPALRRDWPKSSWRARGVLLASGLLVLACLGLIAYHGYYYYIGKRLLWQSYSSESITRANESFLQGDLDRAGWILRACSDVMKDERCKDLLDTLEKRKRLAVEMRRFAIGRARFGSGFRHLLGNALKNDRDRDAYTKAVAAHYREIDALTATYSDAINQLSRGQKEASLRLLSNVNERFPGFGNAHKILEEIGAEMAGRSGGVYLAALRRYGPEAFIRDMVQQIPLPEAEEVLSEDDYSIQ